MIEPSLNVDVYCDRCGKHLLLNKHTEDVYGETDFAYFPDATENELIDLGWYADQDGFAYCPKCIREMRKEWVPLNCSLDEKDRNKLQSFVVRSIGDACKVESVPHDYMYEGILELSGAHDRHLHYKLRKTERGWDVLL